jgi:hypothetical protein
MGLRLGLNEHLSISQTMECLPFLTITLFLAITPFLASTPLLVGFA